MMRRYRFSQTSVELTAEFLAALDCVLIGADHSCFDWPMIVGHAPLIVDTRGATRHLKEWRGKIWPA
jgi:UDP-N-acetyl-D-mannosaminuronate dehydrogenase